MAGRERGPPIDRRLVRLRPLCIPPALRPAMNITLYVIANNDTIRNVTTNKTEAETRLQYANQKGGDYQIIETQCHLDLAELLQSRATLPLPSKRRSVS